MQYGCDLVCDIVDVFDREGFLSSAYSQDIVPIGNARGLLSPDRGVQIVQRSARVCLDGHVLMRGLLLHLLYIRLRCSCWC